MIPSGVFDTAQIGHVCNTVLGKMLQTTQKNPGDQEVPYLRAGLLDSLSDLSELPTMYARSPEIRALRLGEGDLIVAEGGDVGRSEMAPRLPEPTIFQNSLHRVRLRDGGDIRFVCYALSSIYSSGWLDVLCNRATFGHLTVEKLRRLQIPWPGPSVQRAIADYLDTETSRIDTLITKKRRMIELLEQRLVALATRLVTGEGEPQASGIPSIPYTPRRWQVLRNKVFMREVNERSNTGTEELLSVSHLTGVTPRSQKTVYMFKAESMVGYKLVRPGDLAVNTMWAWMGAAGVSRHRGIVSPSYGVYRINPSTVLPNYFDLLVRTPAYVCEMTRYSRGVTSSRLRLYPDELLALRTPVPPIAIQNEIVRRFDDQADKARAAVETLVRQVEVLGERRQALITAAVTGELAVPADRG